MPTSRRNILRFATLGTLAHTTAPLLIELSATSRPSSGAASSHPIRLDRNENPYGPSNKAIGMIHSSAGSANRYPDDEYSDLINKIADIHKVKQEQILLGAGSREILRMAAFSCLSRHDRLVLASPTFGAVADYGESVGAEVSAVPLNKRYQH